MARPNLRRESEIPGGMVIVWSGRPLTVVRQIGTGANAPVILEEMIAMGDALPGQLALWSVAGVLSAMEAA